MTKSQSLTPFQLRFVDEYVRSLDAKSAVILAGYNPDTADSRAVSLLSDEKVLNRIEKKINESATALCPNKAFFAKKLLDILSASALVEPVLDKQGEPTGKTKIADAGSALRAIDALAKIYVNTVKTDEQGGFSFTIDNLNKDKI